LQRHLIASKLDHARAAAAVQRIQWCFLQKQSPNDQPPALQAPAYLTPLCLWT
jgi:hypothetical protein